MTKCDKVGLRKVRDRTDGPVVANYEHGVGQAKPKKTYAAPSYKMLDANTAKAALETRAVPGEADARAMMELICKSTMKPGSCISGDLIVIPCPDRLVTREDTTAFREEVKELISEKHRIVLDLSETDHIDSIGLAGLVGLFT